MRLYELFKGNKFSMNLQDMSFHLSPVKAVKKKKLYSLVNVVCMHHVQVACESQTSIKAILRIAAPSECVFSGRLCLANSS